MADYTKAYALTMEAEGTYSNHPNDRGGETWKGVARNIYPNWPGWKIIDDAKNLPNFPASLRSNQDLEVQVQDFFKRLYWDAIHLDTCPSQSIAHELFDTAVNMGPAIAINFLQQVLNVLNRQESLYTDIAEDGGYGVQTHDAFTAFFQKVPKDRWRAMYALLNCLQGHRYITIAKSRPTQEDFMYGWATRLFEISTNSGL